MKKSKKLLIYAATMALIVGQSSAFATDVSNWTELSNEVTAGNPNIVVTGDFPPGAAPLVNTSSTTVLNLNSNNLTGGGALNQAILYNSVTGTIVISNGTFTGGNNTIDAGGAIANFGILTLADVSFTNNSATGGNGGAIYNTGGTLSINANSGQVSISGNSAGGFGGAIYSNGGTVNLNAIGGDIVFSGNTDLGSITPRDNDVYLTNGADMSLDIASGRNIIFNGGIIGDGKIAKKNDGTLVINGDCSNYTGIYDHLDGNVTVANNFFAGTNNLSDGNMTINTNGSVTLNAGDTWTNTNISNVDGALVIDGITHNTGMTGKYSQSGGSLTLANGAYLNMNSGSSISAGDVGFTGTGSTIRVSGGMIWGSADVNLTTGNDLIVSGGGVYLDTADTWNGDVSVSGGFLVLSGTTHDATAAGAGTYTQTGGALYLWDESNLRVAAESISAASTINVTSVSANNSKLELAYSSDATYNTTVNLQGNGTLAIDTDANTVINTSNTLISGVGSGNLLEKEGTGTYIVDRTGNSADFDYGISVNEGTMKVIADDANFNDGVQVNSATLTTDSANTTFNSNLFVTNGIFNVQNGGFSVAGDLKSANGTINTMNGQIATNTINGSLLIGSPGTSNFMIDVSPTTQTSDKYVIAGDLRSGGGGPSTINISNFNVVGGLPIQKEVTFQVFDIGGTLDPDVSFTSTTGTVNTALGSYTLSSLGEGAYMFSLSEFNSAMFRGQVATDAAYANQLLTNGVLFDHISLVSQQLLANDKANVYAADASPLYSPYQYSSKDGGIWFKSFGNIERLQLTQNINTQNNMWGSLVGADFPIIQLSKGWKLLPTTYIGYTGAYQTYDGVNMYQNGGQGGIMGTFYKDNLISTLMLNGGGYVNDMYADGARDTVGNWFVGAASRTAYNIDLPADFILQPTLLFSYNYFGQQKWGSDFGSVNMVSNGLNGLNMAPGLNLIYNKETWSVYATTQLMFNFVNGCSGSAGDVDLPTVKMGSTYFQYGLGFTKRVKDRLSFFGQIMFLNGVRTGVGFQGGLQWKM